MGNEKSNVEYDPKTSALFSYKIAVVFGAVLLRGFSREAAFFMSIILWADSEL